MPDGSTLAADRLTVTAKKLMDGPAHARAACAWIVHLQGGEANPADLALHFGLFGRDRFYWSRLCALFVALGIDR